MSISYGKNERNHLEQYSMKSELYYMNMQFPVDGQLKICFSRQFESQCWIEKQYALLYQILSYMFYVNLFAKYCQSTYDTAQNIHLT